MIWKLNSMKVIIAKIRYLPLIIALESFNRLLAEPLQPGYAWGENVGWIHLNASSTGGVTAQPEVLPPTASEIAAGIVDETPIPWGSDRQPDGDVDAADVVTRVNDGFP